MYESIAWQLKFPRSRIGCCSTRCHVNGISRYTAYADKDWFGLDPAFSYDGIKGHRSDNKPISFDPIDQFAAEMDDFADCILNHKPSRVPGKEGLVMCGS